MLIAGYWSELKLMRRQESYDGHFEQLKQLIKGLAYTGCSNLVLLVLMQNPRDFHQSMYNLTNLSAAAFAATKATPLRMREASWSLADVKKDILLLVCHSLFDIAIIHETLSMKVCKVASKIPRNGTSRMSERSLNLEFKFRWRADTWRHLGCDHFPIITAEWLALEGIGAMYHKW